jgi:hypothetical protein
LFILTWISLSRKQDARYVYNSSKVNENWFLAGDLNNSIAQNMTYWEANKINSKKDLYNYLFSDFAAIMFQKFIGNTTVL